MYYQDLMHTAKNKTLLIKLSRTSKQKSLSVKTRLSLTHALLLINSIILLEVLESEQYKMQSFYIFPNLSYSSAFSAPLKPLLVSHHSFMILGVVVQIFCFVECSKKYA